MYYSDDHRYVLAFCANKANRLLWAQHELEVDPEELMAEGWWCCLRRCPPHQLRPAMTNTIREMKKYAVNFYLMHNGCRRARYLTQDELSGEQL